jgi:hypothetical protein
VKAMVDGHFEKHDLTQWRYIQMAGILKSMTRRNRVQMASILKSVTWQNRGAFKWRAF